MRDLTLGVVAVLIGAMFCFRGYLAMRVIIPVWGAFSGFLLGASLVSSADDSGLLRTALGWVVGVGVGLLFGLLAYLYFEVSVVIAMSAIGFTIGTSAMVAIGVSWSWVIVLVGVAVGVVLAAISIAGNLPMVILMVLTAVAGASTVIGGIMLITDELQTAEITQSDTVTDRLHDDWWWFALWGGLAVAGLVIQLRSSDRIHGSMRDAWDDSSPQTRSV